MSQPVQPEPPTEEESMLIPALVTILSAVAAYSAGKSAIEGGWRQVANDLQIATKLGGVLTALAQRSVQKILSSLTSVTARNQLTEVVADVISIVVEDAVQRTAQQVTGLAAGEIKRAEEREGASGGHSPAGEPLSESPAPPEKPSPVSPERIRETAQREARRVFQTVEDAAQYHAAEQAGWLRKTWRTKKDARVRSSHAFLEGETIPVGEPFVTLDGHQLRYPHDPLAPASETANCRCRLKVSR